MKIWNYMLMCVVVLCTSCASSKKVVYLQDVVPLKQQDIEQKYEVYVHNDDLLAIMVNSKNPELALPFNMPMVSYQLGSESGGQQRVLGYLVDTNGDIDFPILGKLHVAGLTRLQLTDMIKHRDGAVPELQGVGDGRGERSGIVQYLRRPYHPVGSLEYGGRPDDLWTTRPGGCDPREGREADDPDA